MVSSSQEFSKRTFYSRLKPLHFVVGLLAFFFAIVVSVIKQSADADLLLLASFGLMNLLVSPLLPKWKCNNRKNLQTIASVLLMVVAVLQAFFVVAPFSEEDVYNSSAFSVAILLAATLIHLFIHYSGLDSGKKRVALENSPILDMPSDDERETGTVKWFNTVKGFGFISRDSGEDIFVHFRAIRGEGHRVLEEGERVEFYVMQRDKGLQAEDVVRLDD